MGEGVVREFGMDMHTLLYLKWITNKDQGEKRPREENGHLPQEKSIPGR